MVVGMECTQPHTHFSASMMLLTRCTPVKAPLVRLKLSPVAVHLAYWMEFRITVDVDTNPSEIRLIRWEDPP